MHNRRRGGFWYQRKSYHGGTDAALPLKTTSDWVQVRFYTQMKKNNGHLPCEGRVTDYAAAAMEQIELYCRVIQAVRRLCDILDYFFAANFGSRCLGQASKKASSGLALQLQQPSVRLTHNTWPACVRR